MAWFRGEDAWLQGAVLAIVSTVHLTTVVGILPPWLGASRTGIAVQVSGNALAAMIYRTYYLAATTEPGSVPQGWTPDVSGSGALTEVKKVSRKPRYCQKCQAYKPPRTHHCSICKRCVLRMDHHCAWVNNCVGYYNYGHFYRFLVYVTFTVLYALIVLLVRITHIEFKVVGRAHQKEMLNMTTFELVLIVVDLMFIIVVLMAVGIMLGFHTYYIFTNTTTIEAFQKDRVDHEVRKQRVKSAPFPYDLGAPTRNWRAVMGSGPLACFVSVAPPSDGLAFPVRPSAGRDDGEAGDDAAWPPPLFEEILEAERAKSKDGSRVDVDTGAGVGGSSSSDERREYKDPHKTV